MSVIYLGGMVRIDGPECPRCGCPDSEILKAGGKRWFGVTSDLRGCNHCGKTFSAPHEAPELEPDPVLPAEPPAAAAYHFGPPEVCKGCGTRGRVQSTRKAKRYVKCGKCGRTWKEKGELVK